MTFKEIVNTIIGDIDEDINDTLLVSKIKGYANRGYKELAKREYLEKTLTTELVDGMSSIPSNAIKVYEVKKDGVPLRFDIDGKKVIVDSTGEVEVVYTYIPDSMENDDDEPTTNMGNEEFILSYAKWLYFLSDDQVELAKLYKQECETFDFVIQSDIQSVTDVYGVI